MIAEIDLVIRMDLASARQFQPVTMNDLDRVASVLADRDRLPDIFSIRLLSASITDDHSHSASPSFSFTSSVYAEITAFHYSSPSSLM